MITVIDAKMAAAMGTEFSTAEVTANAPRLIDQKLCELMGQACEQFAYLLQELHIEAPTFIAQGVVTETAIALGAMKSMFNETADVTLPDTEEAVAIISRITDSMMEIAGHIDGDFADEPTVMEVTAAPWPFQFPNPADPSN